VNRHLLGAYHRLPGRLQSVAATMNGHYLRFWRQGRETPQMIRDARDRERWSVGQWENFREARLSYVLNRAATRVPYYRKLWSERRRRGDTMSPARLENWPILEKAALRADALSFVADDCHPRRMFREHTSGTTGTPLDLWRSRATVRAWYALSEARWRQWYGVGPGDRWAMLGGQLVTPVSQRRPPFWVWNAGLNQLYMSSYHLSAESVHDYLDALATYRIRYLLGYTSALYTLADEAIRAGYTSSTLVVAIANAEPVFDFQRRAITRAFNCPLRETYGSAEKTIAASECEAGRLHVWPEVGVLEVVDGDQSVTAATGDLVCTSLLDPDMPLVRYRTGDRGSIEALTGCVCGRTLPILASLEGRADDMVITPDGRRIGRLDPVFKTDLPVREAQVIQDTRDHIRIRYVPDAGFSPSAGDELVRRLRDRVGNLRVTLEPVDAIARTASGKFRSVVSFVHE
jgi:phenylacetate-CoA ligase